MHKKNSGVVVLNKSCADLPHKTVLVLGVPRGGTSMVAGALSKLGIFMGPEYKLAPFYENHELERCVKSKKKTEAIKTIQKYNEAHNTWGLKIMPRSWRFWALHPRFREPVYIIVFRDILAIANRRVVSLHKSLLKEMFAASWYNFWLLLFLAFTKRPALTLSYEKALFFPEAIVTELAHFLGITDHALIEDAIRFITPSPKDYVMRSTTFCQLDTEANYFGYLDIVEPVKVAGWALSLSDNEPLIVELLINGERKYEVEAKSIREDVKKADPRYTDQCGFEIMLNEKDRLNQGDRVEVRIHEKNIHLINSPFTVS